MVKEEDKWRKSDLVKLLNTSTSSAQRNKVVKLLRKFDPVAKKHLDGEATSENLKLKTYTQLQAYVCWRCDKVKQCYMKGTMNTSEGLKTICGGCHNNLKSNIEYENIKRYNRCYG